jgi:hypothetical protein
MPGWRSVLVLVVLAAPGGRRGRPLVVARVAPTHGPAALIVYATGEVEPVHWAKVAPLAPGRIVELCACEGEIGEVVGGAHVLFWVGQPEPLRVVDDVDEEDVPLIVVGLFHTGVVAPDEGIAQVLLKKAQVHAGRPNVINEIRLRLADVEGARALARGLERELGYRAESRDEAKGFFLYESPVTYLIGGAFALVSAVAAALNPVDIVRGSGLTVAIPILEAKALTRILPGPVPVALVRGVDLAVAPGEFLAVTGPSRSRACGSRASGSCSSSTSCSRSSPWPRTCASRCGGSGAWASARRSCGRSRTIPRSSSPTSRPATSTAATQGSSSRPSRSSPPRGVARW